MRWGALAAACSLVTLGVLVFSSGERDAIACYAPWNPGGYVQDLFVETVVVPDVASGLVCKTFFPMCAGMSGPRYRAAQRVLRVRAELGSSPDGGAEPTFVVGGQTPTRFYLADASGNVLYESSASFVNRAAAGFTAAQAVGAVTACVETWTAPDGGGGALERSEVCRPIPAGLSFELTSEDTADFAASVREDCTKYAVDAAAVVVDGGVDDDVDVDAGPPSYPVVGPVRKDDGCSAGGGSSSLSVVAGVAGAMALVRARRRRRRRG